jgi:hypothetical protein
MLQRLGALVCNCNQYIADQKGGENTRRTGKWILFSQELGENFKPQRKHLENYQMAKMTSSCCGHVKVAIHLYKKVTMT